MKNILMVTTTLPRWQNDSESNWVLELAKNLNHSIVILAPFAKGSDKDEMMDKIKIHRFRYSLFSPKLCYGEGVIGNFRKSFRAKLQALVLPFAEFLSMRKLIKQERINLVIAWWIIPQGFLAAINKKLFKTPYICIAAGSDIFPLKNIVFKWLQHFVFRNAKQVIATSSALKKEILSRFPDIEVKIIPVGVNDYFKPKTKYNKKIKSILCVGRLSPQKGFDTAIKATKLMGTKLIIIGEGNHLPQLKKEAEGVDVEFLGRIPNKDLVKYYQDADVFVLPSKGFEALGMVCAEAMASGTPVVASDLDGIKDIVIDSETGLTFKQGDAFELKEKINLAFNNKHILIPNALQHINNFKWENIAKQYMEVI